MCFTKNIETKRIRLQKDVFLLKTSLSIYCTEDKFTTEVRHYDYFKGVPVKKRWIDRVFTYFRTDITGEAYHFHSLRQSKMRIPYSLRGGGYSTGIFKIPKGTIMYVRPNSMYDVDVISFATEYIGEVTEGNKHLILDQENY